MSLTATHALHRVVRQGDAQFRTRTYSPLLSSSIYYRSRRILCQLWRRYVNIRCCRIRGHSTVRRPACRTQCELLRAHAHHPSAADLLASPDVQDAASQFYNSVCGTTTFEYYQTTFPPSPAFPGGQPTPISQVWGLPSHARTIQIALMRHARDEATSIAHIAPYGEPNPMQVYFVNRLSCCNGRILQFNGQLQLLAANGSFYAKVPATYNGTVNTFSFATPVPNPTPNPNLPVQLDPIQRSTAVRYVRVNAAPGQCLHFRDILVSCCDFLRATPVIAYARYMTKQEQSSVVRFAFCDAIRAMSATSNPTSRRSLMLRTRMLP